MAALAVTVLVAASVTFLVRGDGSCVPAADSGWFTSAVNDLAEDREALEGVGRAALAEAARETIGSSGDRAALQALTNATKPTVRIDAESHLIRHYGAAVRLEDGSETVAAIAIDGAGVASPPTVSVRDSVSAAGAPSIELCPPLGTAALVRHGGTTELQNYHVRYPQVAHAVDLVVWRDGAVYRTNGASNADHWIWDAPVHSPVNGRVVAVRDGVADNTPYLVSSNTPGLFGNHVIISADDGAVVLAHLRRGSVAVEAGAEVRRGDEIGRVGNSGNSDVPHLHVHAQDVPRLSDGAASRQIEFRDLVADCAPTVRPVQGEIIWSAAGSDTVAGC